METEPADQPSGATAQTDPATPTQKSDPHHDKYVVLCRPHTVLMMASVRGGKAVRGAFTGAMAEQFRQADGKTDINTMFTRANASLQKHEVCQHVNQIAEIRHTMTKDLILPSY